LVAQIVQLKAMDRWGYECSQQLPLSQMWDCRQKKREYALLFT